MMESMEIIEFWMVEESMEPICEEFIKYEMKEQIYD